MKLKRSTIRRAAAGLLAACLSGWATAASDAAVAASPPTELRLGFTRSWAMPWGEVVGDEVRAGIHRDIGEALARRLGLPLVWARVPQQREIAPHSAEHMRRHADLGCGMHPSWFPNAAHHQWSPPLFDIGDQLVGRQGQAAPATVNSLPSGTRVGTVRGYHYPMLQPLFDSGQLRRDDAPDQAAALRKLVRGHTAVAVVSQQSLHWFQRQHPDARLADWRLPVQAAQYHCAIPKGSSLPPEPVWQALEAMKREGELARILARYAPG